MTIMEPLADDAVGTPSCRLLHWEGEEKAGFVLFFPA